MLVKKFYAVPGDTLGVGKLVPRLEPGYEVGELGLQVSARNPQVNQGYQ